MITNNNFRLIDGTSGTFALTVLFLSLLLFTSCATKVKKTRNYPVSFSFSDRSILEMDSLFIYPSKNDSILCYKYSMKVDIQLIYDSIFSLGGVRFNEGMDYLCKWTNINGDSIIRNYTNIKVGYEIVYNDSLPCLESYKLKDKFYKDTRFRIDY